MTTRFCSIELNEPFGQIVAFPEGAKEIAELIPFTPDGKWAQGGNWTTYVWQGASSADEAIANHWSAYEQWEADLNAGKEPRKTY